MTYFRSSRLSNFESGVVSGGLELSLNVGDPTLLDISNGNAIFSNYDVSPPIIFDINSVTVSPGNTTQAPDLATVYSGDQSPWPILQATDIVFFYVIGADGNLYQTNTSPLTGDVVRQYLTIGAVQLDNTLDRNIIGIFNFQNNNAKNYENANILTPIFSDASSGNISGNSSVTTFNRLETNIYFYGLNNANAFNPNIKNYPALNPLPFTVSFQLTPGVFTLINETDFASYVGLFDTGTANGTPLPQGNVGANNFVVHYALFEASLGLEFIQIGQNTYGTIQQAIDAINNGDESILISPALLGLKNHYYIIMKGNASDFSDAAQVTFLKPSGRFFNQV